VKAFTTPSLATEASFFAYPGFTGGVRVAAGDLTGDGLADIVTGVGPGAGPHVKVFDRSTLSEVRSSSRMMLVSPAECSSPRAISRVITGPTSSRAPARRRLT